MCRYLHRHPLLILVLLIVLAPTSMVGGTRPGITTDEKLDALLSQFAQFKEQIAQIPSLTNWMSRMDSHITRTLGDLCDQTYRDGTGFQHPHCTYVPGRDISGSARSWPSVEQVDGSTAAGPHGPGSSDDNRNTRRRLDTLSSTEDEQSRSAVLLRFPCEQYHKGITKWIDNLWEETNMPTFNKPVRIHCKAGSVSVRLVFETRAKCQDFIARYKDDGIPYATNSPFCCANTNIIVRQSKSNPRPRARKTICAFVERIGWPTKNSLPCDGDDEGAFIIPALDARSHVLTIKDRRNGVGKPVFKLAPLGSGQTFTLVAPDLCVPGISHEILQRVLSQANRPNV